jgi:hypothetical protein
MKSDVWLTPPTIISALGPFDLDPCAAPDPRPWPTAIEHIAKPDDGLAAVWPKEKLVWLNPPYSREAVKWMRRMVDHGNGIALVFARTETEWFWECVWRAPTATAVLFLEGRLYFHHQTGERAAANSGAPSVLVAYGRKGAARLLASGLSGAFMPICVP